MYKFRAGERGGNSMRYNFDQVIDRHNTYSTQWDYTKDRFGSDDVLPFSISDTDFQVPNEILDSMNKRLEHPIFGYTRWNHQDYKNSIIQWFEDDGITKVDEDWIVYSPSVVYTIGTLIRELTDEGDGVATFIPMYDAFFNTIEANGRQLLPIKIKGKEEFDQIDWDTLETVLSQKQTKIFLLTNPHNPTGHLFTKEELIKIVEVCQRNHVFIISDDIHRDLLVREGQSYIPITDITDRDVALCCSSTKIFNTPGLIGAYAFIPDLELRDKYLKNLKQKDALSSASILGIESMMAGYMGSKDYVIELREYLRDNYEILAKFLRKEFPEIKFEIPDATYLAWINISELTMTAEELQDRLVNNGKVGIMSGKVYGDSRYIRMNVGCPKTKLVEGLKRMKEALHS